MIVEVVADRFPVQAHIGISAEELEVLTPLVLTIRATVQQSATQTDKVSDTVDYAMLADIGTAELTARPHKTMENAAWRIAKKVTQFSMKVQTVEIILVKLAPHLPAGASFQVRIRAERREILGT